MAIMESEGRTDERLDDLRSDMNRRFGEVDRRSEEVDRRFQEVKGEIRELRAHTDKGFAEVKGDIRDLRSEMNAMQRTIVIGFVSLFASIVAALLGTAFLA